MGEYKINFGAKLERTGWRIWGAGAVRKNKGGKGDFQVPRLSNRVSLSDGKNGGHFSKNWTLSSFGWIILVFDYVKYELPVRYTFGNSQHMIFKILGNKWYSQYREHRRDMGTGPRPEPRKPVVMGRKGPTNETYTQKWEDNQDDDIPETKRQGFNRGLFLWRILVRHAVKCDLSVHWFGNSPALMILTAAVSGSRRVELTRADGWLCTKQPVSDLASDLFFSPRLLLYQKSLLTALPTSPSTLLRPILSTSHSDSAVGREATSYHHSSAPWSHLRATVK